ncbi:MAG: carboxymuconolactone decarboxylase family protein [Chthoniobacterales bacterium]
MMLPLPPDESLPEPVVQRLKERPPINVWRMLGHVPQCVIPITDMAKALYQGTLSPREREVGILRHGARLGSPYEVHQHRLLALGIGMTEEEIKEVTDLTRLPDFSEREKMICVIADKMEANGNLDDETFAKGQAEFGASQFVEVLLLVSFYACIGRFVNGTRLSVEKSNPLAGRASPN